jgi:predicted nucleic acid-binding protein
MRSLERRAVCAKRDIRGVARSIRSRHLCLYHMQSPQACAPRFGCQVGDKSMMQLTSRATNSWTDAWLAALAMSLDYEMTTFDRGFKSFRDLKLRLLKMPDR